MVTDLTLLKMYSYKVCWFCEVQVRREEIRKEYQNIEINRNKARFKYKVMQWS